MLTWQLSPDTDVIRLGDVGRNPATNPNLTHLDTTAFITPGELNRAILDRPPTHLSTLHATCTGDPVSDR